jgi:PLP dependent protein
LGWPGDDDSNMKRKLSENYKRVRDRISAACERSGRDPEAVRLIAVTKMVEVDVIRCAIEMGMLDLGERRVQDLIKRAGMINEHLTRRRTLESQECPPNPRWHMIGHLQRNKVRPLLPWIEMIHSLDSLRLAEEISDEAVKLNRVIPCLIEINVSGEKSKYGIAVGAASYLAEQVVDMPGLSIVGLMTMAPLAETPEEARPYFRRLREVLEDMKGEGVVKPEFRELSMGMTNDFDVAIEEGATMIRVGTALFDGLAAPGQ